MCSVVTRTCRVDAVIKCRPFLLYKELEEASAGSERKPSQVFDGEGSDQLTWRRQAASTPVILEVSTRPRGWRGARVLCGRRVCHS